MPVLLIINCGFLGRLHYIQNFNFDWENDADVDDNNKYLDCCED